jgi:hypothetical protein
VRLWLEINKNPGFFEIETRDFDFTNYKRIGSCAYFLPGLLIG